MDDEIFPLDCTALELLSVACTVLNGDIISSICTRVIANVRFWVCIVLVGDTLSVICTEVVDNMFSVFLCYILCDSYCGGEYMSSTFCEDDKMPLTFPVSGGDFFPSFCSAVKTRNLQKRFIVPSLSYRIVPSRFVSSRISSTALRNKMLFRFLSYSVASCRMVSRLVVWYRVLSYGIASCRTFAT